MIRPLPWVQSGNQEDVDESRAILNRIAARSPEAFLALMDKPWMHEVDSFTDDGAGTSILYWFEQVVLEDDSATADVAAAVAQLPFLDSLDRRNDLHTLTHFMILLRHSDQNEAKRFLANPALPDAIWPADVVLLYMESQGREIATAINEMQWIQDGVEPWSEEEGTPRFSTKASLESRVVADLFEVLLHSPETFLGITRKPWAQDGFGNRESLALSTIQRIARRNEVVAERLVNMPFLETFEDPDNVILGAFGNLGSGGLETLLNDPLFYRGISDGQVGTASLLTLRIEKRDSAALVEALSWVQDGLVPSEQDMVFQLCELGLESSEALRAIVAKPWVQDGASPSDGTLLEQLVFSDSDHLEKVLSHPTLKDGITDEQTVALAAINLVRNRRPDLVEVLLDPGRLTVERRLIELPYTGEMLLSVIHLTPGARFRTMDILEEAARRQEGFMKMPFPKTYVGLLVADVNEAGGGGSPKGLLHVDPGLEEHEQIISHELAHIYWASSPAWIAEGGAEFFSSIATGEVFLSNPCDVADNLSELDNLDWERQEQGLPEISRSSGCAYTLGRALFADLHESLGDAASSAGFGRLYKATLGELLNEDCMEVERGFCYLTHAFVIHADEESAAIAEPIIRRHYYGE